MEARATIDILEVMYTAFDTRKESRGFHQRLDYPDREDVNWLKWVIMTKGEDGRPQASLEEIPIEKYKWKPEGYQKTNQ